MEPNTKLTARQRNQEIFRMWTFELMTLEAIGQKFGITRERVRQILREAGADASKNIRAQRRDVKAEEFSAEVVALLEKVRDSLKYMQEQGHSTPEVRVKLRAMYPSASDEVIDSVIRRSKIVFLKGEKTFHFTEDAVRACVWHAIGHEHDVTATRDQAIAVLEPALVVEIQAALEAQGLSGAAIQDALQRVAGGRMHITSGAEIHLAHKDFEQVREDFINEHGIEAGKGAMIWPVTRQTVMKRFGSGSWTDALATMGVQSSIRGGRAKGQLIFSAADYAASIRDYLAFAQVSGKNVTFAGYEKWVVGEKASHRLRPSGASVRNIYGGWLLAVQSEGNPAKVGILTAAS